MPQTPVQTQSIDRNELARFLPEKAFRLIKSFENLFHDVSKTIPDAIGQAVQGPSGGSVDDNVVVFDGSGGYLVKDSGVSIDDLAPLESPVFTGVPTAPTATAGTSTAQIATTAFVNAELNNSVDGPAIATNNAIALFDGVSGKLIKDSATLLSSLAPLASPAFTGVPTVPTAAPGTSTTQAASTAFVATSFATLASPAFTGNPTAPTAAPGDNDTSIATTAFVAAAITAAVPTNAAYFSAHNNGVAQSIPTAAFTTLNMSTEVYDVGSKFAANAWTPPARLVSMVGAVAINSAAVLANYTVSVFKNGAEFKRGTMHLVNLGGGAVIATVDCQDVANGTDVYDLRAFQTTGAAQNTTGAATVTYFQGATIQA
jgi:hypothetical protein